MPPTAARLDGPEGAPVLVLSNSLGTSSAMWEPQMTAFTGHFRVLRYEHRGHGGSAAPPGPYTIAELVSDLIGFLDDLEIERASICGLSLGGMVAMGVAAAAPERVDRLVLACTAPRLAPAEQWVARAAEVRRSGTAAQLEGHVRRWFTPGFAADRPDVVRHIADMLAAVEAEGYASCCEAVGAMDQTADLGRITAPTLVVAAAHDPVVPPTLAVEVQQLLPSSSLVVLSSAAHLANVEQPARFNAAVLDHLAGPPAERGDRVRRDVLGDAHVERAAGQRTSFSGPFQELITRYAWGEIWTRPGLDRSTRSGITIAMLVALGRFDELAMHLRGALRNGLSADEIAEVLLQTAVYCGVPAANRAFAVAQQLFDESRLEDTADG
jgi:3-oxoadipate enol-lactonase/4-carboxymuconolactone decarboxylase